MGGRRVDGGMHDHQLVVCCHEEVLFSLKQ